MIFETPTAGPEEDGALEKIRGLRQQLRFQVAEPRRWLGLVRRVLAARAVQGSNSIEGYNVTVEDAVAAIEGEEPTEAERENWLAVVGYQRAMTYVLQLAGDPHFAYTPDLLRSLHFMMTEYAMDASPGLWRSGPIWVRRNTGEVVYEGPDAEEVPDLVGELVDSLKQENDVPVTIRAAMAHLNLVMIHPFRDGNGRMARGLQTLVLAREGIVAAPFSSIEEYLGANTERYYEVLGETGRGQWKPSGDARAWIRFCLEAHYVQAATVLRRVTEASQIWTEAEGLRRAHRLPDRAMAALFDAAIGLRVRNSSYRAVLEDWEETISHQVATSDLGAMVEARLLDRRGKKRGTFYVASEELGSIRKRLAEEREPIDPSRLFDTAA